MSINKTLNKMEEDFEDDSQESEISLTEEQKQKIIELWKKNSQTSPISLKDLTLAIFPGLEFDGRSKQGKAIKKFLVSFGIKPKVNVHEKIGEYELSTAEKEFILNNINSMKTLEMAKILWGDKMTPLAREFRALKKFVDSEIKINFQDLNNQNNIESENESDEIFSPPKNYNECLKLINKYNYDILSTQDISEKQRQGIYTLIRYLNSPRFIKTISTFKDKENQELFLSEFVRATYDKPDLTVDETNLYISLAASYPLEQMALAERESLSEKLEQETIDGRISQATVEAINAKNKEYQDCQARQEKLIKELNGSRSKRIESQRSASSSIMSLIEYCREEKKRQRLIRLGDIKKKAEIECSQQLFNMDAVKAEIFGAIQIRE